MGLYEQSEKQKPRKINPTVKTWFRQEALRTHGWSAAMFVPEVQTQHGAGCVLYKQPLQINAFSVTIALPGLDEVDPNDADESDVAGDEEDSEIVEEYPAETKS
jgi:hypothetical protein